MTTTSNKTTLSLPSSEGVVLHGYYKKLKTMKKKYFVLYEDCQKYLARLEYYDNEKKFKTKAANPKRTIILKSCFNINRRLDTKHEYVITLSTKDGGFDMVMDSEEDMNKWLKTMLQLQNPQNVISGPPKQSYEHVWQVVVQKKGLAEKKGILGSYHVCLSSKSVTLKRIGSDRTSSGEARATVVEFFLTSIRRCGDSKCIFYMEVGRHSVIGAGELWMETKDSSIAQNMHSMILNVMSSNVEEPYGPMRKRSSSATESSKPIATLQRRQTHSGSKTINSSSPLSAQNRDRCDSLPSSRNRTTTESGYQSLANTSMPPSRTMSSLSTVSNSIYNRYSHSPPMNSNVLSPSVGCSESDGSTLSIDEPDSMKHSLTPDESAGYVSRFYNSRSPGGVIPEENCDEFWYTDNKKQNSIENALDLDKLNIHTGVIVEGRKQTLSSSSNAHSEEPESQYMDMFNSISSFDTALCDTTLPVAVECCNDSSDGNSRASSLAEEVVDGYVHMSSPQTSNYVNMEQSMKNRRQNFNLNSSSSARGGAVPIKDMCFAEYPLEKVHAANFPDEDDGHHLNERPPRAYSVGSRIEHNKQKLRIEVITNADQNNCRVRAFSVGSRSKVPRCDLQRSVLIAANSNSTKPINMNNSKTSIISQEPISESTVRGRKSSSAPLLIHKSQNSVDRMDDLMEIDFSKNSSSRSNSLSSQSPGASSYLINHPKSSHSRNSILSSSPGQSVLSKRSHDSFSETTMSTTPTQSQQQQRIENGYLEMRPVIYSQSPGKNDEPFEHTLVPNDSSIAEVPETPCPRQSDLTHNKIKVEEWDKMETPEGYLEMSWNGNKDINHTQNSNELPNVSVKSRSPLIDIKKSRGVNKMPSIIAGQSLDNNRTSVTTGNVSKFSTLQNQATQKSSTFRVSPKCETIRFKHDLDDLDNSCTIFEEVYSSPDKFTAAGHNFNDIFPKRSLLITRDDLPYVPIDPCTADTVFCDSVNFSGDISKQVPSPNKDDMNIVEREKIRDTDCQSNRNSSSSIKSDPLDSNKNKENKLISSDLEESLTDEGHKLARKSNSPKCTPTSPHSSSLRCHRYSNTNRQASNKNTGYALLHICSDSSLQTKKNISRPSSVNSDRIFPQESTQCRPNSVNSDCLQNSVKPVPITNSAYNDDNTQSSTDSVSSKGLSQHIVANEFATNALASKLAALCHPSSNTQLELHYASLDLPISSTKNSNTTIYESLINPARSSSTSDDTATSLSPNSNTSQQSVFTYAKIDFNQCESKKFQCGTQNNL